MVTRVISPQSCHLRFYSCPRNSEKKEERIGNCSQYLALNPTCLSYPMALINTVPTMHSIIFPQCIHITFQSGSLLIKGTFFIIYNGLNAFLKYCSNLQNLLRTFNRMSEFGLNDVRMAFRQWFLTLKPSALKKTLIFWDSSTAQVKIQRNILRQNGPYLQVNIQYSSGLDGGLWHYQGGGGEQLTSLICI